MYAFSQEERRARLVQRHRLGSPHRATTIGEVIGSLLVLHATDPQTVFLSTIARLEHADPIAHLEDALYVQRSLIRLHAMRQTIFVMDAALRPIFLASNDAKGYHSRTGFLKRFPTVTREEMDAAEAGVLAYLRNGADSTRNVVAAVPELQDRKAVPHGSTVEVSIGTQLLRTLAYHGVIERGRPAGSWLSNQFVWTAGVPMELPDPLEARAEVLRRWLAAYGPGTLADLKWWTGWTMRDTKAALALVDTEDVALDGGAGLVLAGDTSDAGMSSGDHVALLPALDSTVMGYRERDWYLDPAFVPQLFDRNGNAGPTIWWNGRVIGGWSHAPSGEVRWRLLAPVPAHVEEAIAGEADRLIAILGEARIMPRFRTPLERELVAHG